MAGRAAVFFDLHGTLGAAHGDAGGDFPQFSWYYNGAEAIRLVNQAGLCAIAVTNQGPIAHGRFTLEDFWNRMADLERELREQGARLDAVYCCPHSREDGCNCCKPRIGLVDDACREFHIDPRLSYVVGDRGDFDTLLAWAIGARGVLVRTGEGEGSLGEFRQTWAEVEADYIGEHVVDAVDWIIRQYRSNRVPG
jgi:D-glycero-D-manno-heptose 1,7-bisphosphate phosphatase